MGRSGTLRKRLRGLKGGVIRGKTGTLDNVSSLAAYAFSDTGYKYAFVSIANGSAVRRAKQFEEELAKLLLLGK
jgi:D-alanyl-D-alanine carboxypeptidase